ncbi:MAG: ABC transporter substrate-binding protein [Cyanobacteria bacterium P01_G01_bin.54]
MRRFSKALLLLLLLLSFGLTLFIGLRVTAPPPFTIAVVLQSEQDLASTQDVLTGIRAALEEAKYDPAFQGQKIELRVEFDNDDPEQAAAIAQQLVQDKEILAVIGHDSSNTSLAAGAIYQREKLPAITWSATAEEITADNPWYFRALYNNRIQGQYLAQYISKELGQPNVVVIYNESNPYSQSLNQAFTPAFAALGGEIRQTYRLKQPDQSTDREPDNAQSAQSAQAIAEVIQALPPEEMGLIVLLTGSSQSPQIVVALKDQNIATPIMGSNALSNGRFMAAFRELTDQQPNRPLGFYTDGIYTVVPFFFDMLGSDGAHLREEYRDTYPKSEPSWKLGTAHEATKFLVTALKNAPVSGQPQRIAADRDAVRQALAEIDYQHAVPGISEPLYFDEHGDFPETPTMGLFQRGQLLPAFKQLTPITLERSPTQLAREQQNGQIVKVGDQFFNQTFVVYTGIRPQDIREIDLDHQTVHLNFELWFRYASDLPESVIRDIRFLNAAEDIKLGKPESSEEIDGVTYSFYKVGGLFHINTLNQAQLGLGEQILSVSFVNHQLNHRALIYVKDSLGLGFGQSRDATLAKSFTDAHVLESQNWLINQVTFFQESVTKDLLGIPFDQSTDGHPEEFSQLNMAIKVTPDELTIRRMGSERLMLSLYIFGMVMLVLLIIEHYFQVIRLNRRWGWLLTTIASCAFLYGGETLLLYWLTNLPTVVIEQIRLGNNPLPNVLTPIVRLLTRNRAFFVTYFDVVWWCLAAYLVNAAVGCFVWQPLEATTRHKIPTLVRRMVPYVIYSFTGLAIAAYVFNSPITSLLATSGLALGIIGLAVQINISNIFAGLAINLEGTFKVGDFIEIPAQNLSGYVEDINWRATRIRTRANNTLLIPNSDINSQTVINCMIPNDGTEILFRFTLEPGTDKTEALAALNTAIQVVAQDGSGVVLNEPAPLVRITDTSIYGVEYAIICWYRPVNTSNSKISDVVNQSVLEHLSAAGIRLSSSVQVRPWEQDDRFSDLDDFASQ